METYENLFQSICRICITRNNEDRPMVPLTDRINNGLSVYGKAVTKLVNNMCMKEKDLPSQMCLDCLGLLQQALRFKLLCESSYKKLINIAQISGNNFVSNLVEYTMYNAYFPPEYDKSLHVTGKRPISNLRQLNDHSDKDESSFLNSPETMTYEDYVLDNIENTISNMDTTGHSKKDEFKKKEDTLQLIKNNQKKINISKQSCKKNVNKDYKCSICHKLLPNINTYNLHMQRHNGFRFICEHCGKRFSFYSYLQVHLVARHGTGRYLQCPQCNFKAYRKFDLVEHERLHTGERPYACDKCGLTFRRCSLWKKHLKFHKEKTIQCPQCPRKFHQRSDLIAHSNNIHERMYVYMCNICRITYAKVGSVRRHLTERHGIPREKQGKILRLNKGRSIDFPDQYRQKS